MRKWKFNNSIPSSFMLDCEIVTFRSRNKLYITIPNSVKTAAEKCEPKLNMSIDVSVITFDLLYDDRILLEKTHRERRSMLDQIFYIDGGNLQHQHRKQ